MMKKLAVCLSGCGVFDGAEIYETVLTLLAKLYPAGTKLTIGHDATTKEAINAMGGAHQDCDVDEIAIDEKQKVVSTPAYMLAQSIHGAKSGIDKLVAEVLRLTE